jgi:6-phosphogluconolactonase (cycloisomerase 2 family)
MSIRNLFRFLLIAAAASVIFQFSIDNAGALTPMSPASTAGGSSGAFLALTPDRRFLFTDDVGATVFRFSVDQTTGELTLVSTASITITGNASDAIVFHVPR